jgi:serine/threonine protein kinase
MFTRKLRMSDQVRVLGSGRQGSVSLCLDQAGGQIAVKQFTTLDFYRREAAILAQLRGAKNVVQLASSADAGLGSIALKYYSRGELYSFMDAANKFDDALAKHVITQCITGLADVHAIGIAHQDIKPENIFVDEDFSIVIGDFGLAATASSTDPVDFRGTLSYMAPEIFTSCRTLLPYDRMKADIWSIGVLLFVMLTGNMPFGEGGATARDWYSVQLKHNRSEAFWGEHEKYLSHSINPLAKAFITKCLTFDPALRMSASELLVDPWFMDGTPLTTGEYQEQMRVVEQRVLELQSDALSAMLPPSKREKI